MEWKESIIVAIYNKSDKRDCRYYNGMSVSSTTYKMLSNILISSLTPYAEVIIGDQQCGFRRKRSTTDHIFCIRGMVEKEWEYSEYNVDFKKASDSVRRQVFRNILIESGIHMKLVRLKKICLNGTFSRVRVGRHLSAMFPIMNSLWYTTYMISWFILMMLIYWAEATYEGGPTYLQNLNLPHKRDIVKGSATRYSEPTIF